jgi:hypothetical protein
MVSVGSDSAHQDLRQIQVTVVRSHDTHFVLPRVVGPAFIVGDIHVCPRIDEEPRDLE